VTAASTAHDAFDTQLHVFRRDTDRAKLDLSEPPTIGIEGRGSDHEIIDESANRGPFGDHSRAIARRIFFSNADGEDPPVEDVEALVSAVLSSPMVKAARAVIDADPRYVRARLIELAAMVACREWQGQTEISR
jgi:hypothetical protein